MPKQKSRHVDSAERVGQRLKEARLRAGLSQKALSFQGCTPAYISRVEAGERIPSLQILKVLGERLGVSAEYLATGREVISASSTLVEADVALRLDDLDAADGLFRQALEETTQRNEEARAHAGLGQLAFRRDDFDEAISELEHAMQLFGDDRFGYPRAADTLGRAYATAGRPEEAIALFEEWLAAMKEREDLVETVRFEVLLSNALIDAGSFGRASELLGSALAKSADWSDPVVQASMYWSQSRLHALQHDGDTAARYARRALEILEMTELTGYTAKAYHLLAFTELERGEAGEALRLLREGRDLLGEAAGDMDVAKFQLEEARALAALGENEEAAALALETAALLRRFDPADAGRAYQAIASIFADIGELARARELYELALDSLERCGSPYLSDTYRGLADVLKADGKTDEAFAMLEKAVAVQSQVRRPL
jgi:tetratricopeptide (TPR) repeat protein